MVSSNQPKLRFDQITPLDRLNELWFFWRLWRTTSRRMGLAYMSNLTEISVFSMRSTWQHYIFVMYNLGLQTYSRFMTHLLGLELSRCVILTQEVLIMHKTQNFVVYSCDSSAKWEKNIMKIAPICFVRFFKFWVFM